MSRWGWFGAWLLVGCAASLGVLSILTIGIFVLPIAGAAFIVLLTRRASIVGVPGFLSGLSVPLFYVAYLNRDGPGTVCDVTHGGGTSCTDEWSPWPFFAIGVVLFLTGIAIFVLVQRNRGRGPYLPAPGA